MSKKISRRLFFNRSLGAGAGIFLTRRKTLGRNGPSGGTPIIITSHTNETGRSAMDAGWDVLNRGGSALDAIEKAANIIEIDPEDRSVGYGGFPNEEGIVQLDASIMDGKTYNAGAVACLENIKTPSSVARVVMEHTDPVLMAGKDALEFAVKCGFKEEDLLTEETRRAWLQRKREASDRDDWGPPDHLALRKDNREDPNHPVDVPPHGTTNVLAVDSRGDVAGITTTSGLGNKIPGRVGDSPIIGAGLYVDNEVGAAGATGRGEDVIKSCASYYIVLRMRDGRSPQDACVDALKMIADRYRKVNPHFFPSEKFVAINTKGEFGCAFMRRNTPARMSVMNSAGYHIHEGTVAFPFEYPEEIELEPEALNRFAGSYSNGFAIAVEGKRLSLKGRTGRAVTLHAASASEFFARRGDLRIVFVTNNAAVSGFRRHEQGRTQDFLKIK